MSGYPRISVPTAYVDRTTAMLPDVGVHVIDCGHDPQRNVVIKRFRATFLSGSATTWRPVLWSADPTATPTPSLLHKEYDDGTALSTASPPVLYDSGSVDIQTQFQLEVQAERSAKLWFQPNPDAGADNIFEVTVDLEWDAG